MSQMQTRGRGRIGVLVPYTNSNLEADMAMLCPPGVSLHYTRLGDYQADEIPDEKQMATLGAADISAPLRLLAGVKPDVILYGCTSATLTHGLEFDLALSRNTLNKWNIPTLTAAGSLVYALNTLKLSSIGFASPYVAAINRRAADFLASSGIAIVSHATIGKTLGNYAQGELSPAEVRNLARQADSKQAQAIVLSCTDMRAVETVNDLEAELGKPVITSNQAMLYNALNYLDVSASEIDCGQLFRIAIRR